MHNSEGFFTRNMRGSPSLVTDKIAHGILWKYIVSADVGLRLGSIPLYKYF